MGTSLRLSARIWSSIGVLIIGYIFSLFFSYSTFHRIQDKLSNISNFAVTSTEISQKVIAGFGRQTKFYEDAVMLGQSELLDEAKKEASCVKTALNGLKSLSGISEKNQQNIIEISTILESYTDSANSVYYKMSRDETDDVSEQDIVHLTEENKNISKKLNELSIAVQHNVSENISSVIKNAKKSNNINVILSLLIIGISVFIIFIVIKRSITRVLYQLSEGINKSSQRVASGSFQIFSASQSFSEGASEQAASIEETSSSLEEMSSMTKQNADNADQADNLMKKTNHVVDKANESMNELINSIEDISKASEDTQQIIKTIDEIAFQTNLLALNAAVEAARAGESGAGFAVVADEVRNLAMRAAEAAKNTAELIEGTMKKVNEGSELVSRTNEAFTEVAGNVSKGGELVGEIAAASNEQAQGIEQVNRAVVEMDKVTQQNAANAEETASASEEMKQQAEQMKKFVNELTTLVGGPAKGMVDIRPTNTSLSEVTNFKAKKIVDSREVMSDQVVSMDDDFGDF
ncbi:MAG: hypothetical protein JRI32_04550 [Deltaproteobacteria bacterium]|nr:hypothetical protein [Deltaproteobacteria bacterium]